MIIAMWVSWLIVSESVYTVLFSFKHLMSDHLSMVATVSIVIHAFGGMFWIAWIYEQPGNIDSSIVNCVLSFIISIWFFVIMFFRSTPELDAPAPAPQSNAPTRGKQEDPLSTVNSSAMSIVCMFTAMADQVTILSITIHQAGNSPQLGETGTVLCWFAHLIWIGVLFIKIKNSFGDVLHLPVTGGESEDKNQNNPINASGPPPAYGSSGSSASSASSSAPSAPSATSSSGPGGEAPPQQPASASFASASASGSASPTSPKQVIVAPKA